MKKSLVIAAIWGTAVVLGIVWYVENNKKNDETDNEFIKNELDDEKPFYSILNEQKSTVASTISERHGAAAQIIKEILDKDNVEVSESEHKVDFDEIDSNLGNLLDEEQIRWKS